jgi:phage shock protein A
MTAEQTIEAIGQASARLESAARAGDWDDAAAALLERGELIASLGALAQSLAEPAYRSLDAQGEQARAALEESRTAIAREIAELRAARRAAGVWKPYREATGATLDVRT